MKKLFVLSGIVAACLIFTFCLKTVDDLFADPQKNADLAGIETSQGILYPPFNPETDRYTIDVASAVTSVTLTGSPEQSDATVSYNPSGTIDLLEGDNQVMISVTSADGSTTRDYIVAVIRSRPEACFAATYRSDTGMTIHYLTQDDSVSTALENSVGEYTVLSCFMSETDLYAAATFTETRTTPPDQGSLTYTFKYPYYWKNGARVALPVENQTYGGEAKCIFVDGTDIYVTGGQTDANQRLHPGYWMNGTFIPLDLPYGSGGWAEGVVVADSVLYIAGGTWTTAPVACYWRNGSRLPLSTPAGTAASYASTLCVRGNDLYIVGATKGASGYYVPCVWKNGVRTDLPVPAGSKDVYARNPYVVGENVYCAGAVQNSSGVYQPFWWLNGARTALSAADPAKTTYSESIFVDGADVYVAGLTTSSGGDEIACIWKNGTRTDLVLDAEAIHSKVVHFRTEY